MEKGPVAAAGLLTSQKVLEQEFQDIVTNNTPVATAAQNANQKLDKLIKGQG